MLASVLMIGAHPDDEYVEVLAYAGRNRLARTAYLSLTRGEGGQNLLGPEQNELLGLVRTQELLAARRIDGAEQYFTRAIDFGFSRSAGDTIAKWGRHEVLSDLVWIIRRFRPDVVVQTFEGSSGLEHAHHKASGILAAEAFHLAADGNSFPEQLQRVAPWRAARLLQVVTGLAPEGPAIQIDATQTEPVEGLPLAETARRTRGMHRSQGFDSPARRTPPRCWLSCLAGEPVSGDLFDHVDTTWGRVPGAEEAGLALKEAARLFEPGDPGRTALRLAEARPLVAAIEDPWARVKLRELDETIALCLGVSLRAIGESPEVLPGQLLQVRLEGTGARTTVQVPETQPCSQPYWLEKPHGPHLYTVENPELIGLAESPAPLTVRFIVSAGGRHIEFERPVEAPGESAGPVAVVAPVSVSIPEGVHLFSNSEPRSVCAVVRSHAGGAHGEMTLDVPAGWTVEPVSRPFHLAGSGERTALAFMVTPPPSEARSACTATAAAGGRRISFGLAEVRYPGLARQVALEAARTVLLRADIETFARQVGYVMGPGDTVPAALRQLGCAVTLLGEDELRRGRLERFDAIVTGVRAFNVRRDLHDNRRRLLSYVEAGGAWVVQYSVADRRAPEQVAGIGPYPLSIGRDRVVSAEAPVAFLEPGHPLVSFPNRIGERDFCGWVQERGLYFAAEWDPRYTPLFECSDPGLEPLRGATLYARHGRGVFIFTAFSWFRQLPAGVAGAYRMLANMVSAAKTAG